MDLHLFLSPPLNSIITIFFILIIVPSSYGQDSEQFLECTRPFQCGNISNVTYPFWGNNRSKQCRLEIFKLHCEENQYPVIDIDVLKFRVLNINQPGHTMTIARMGNWDDVCTPERLNVTLNHSLFGYPVTSQNLSLFYNCSTENRIPVPYEEINCPINDVICDPAIYYVNDSLRGNYGQELEACGNSIRVTVLQTNLDLLLNEHLKLQDALDRGFDVEYGEIQWQCEDCKSSGGSCVYNRKKFLCRRNDASNRALRRLIVGATAAVIVLLLTCIIIYYFRRKASSIMFFRKIRKNDKNLEASIRSYGTLALKRYSFSSIKKMTNSFKDKLGQGGYGGVYKGKLLDGRLVAVKVLNASKGNGEGFINEVASISRTSHVNIVSLLGFCLEGRKRALIYEFMPNGSLEKFIYNDITLTTSYHLGWEKLYQIAIGIARGLEYLHRGCNTRILHFDIKPHNILLDEDLCPKISDFGLAKLCTKKESIISMLEARGTIGYIAPEVFSRNFGGVSHKSDVYSYGMMVLEMVGGRKNIDVGVSHTSEIYFPHWVYKRLELDTEFELHGVTTGEEIEIVRKMILVGLWCIQTKPSDRPSMGKVIEMLKGNVEALEIPPSPFLSSPPRSPPLRSPSNSSTTSLS